MLESTLQGAEEHSTKVLCQRHEVCFAIGVVARDFKDLIAWQLAYELRCEVFAITANGLASRDFKFRDHIRDASASAPRNIAEGFGRFRPKEFARFLSIARASLFETRHHLIDGCERGYFDSRTAGRLSNLARAANKATTNLMLAKLRQAQADKPPAA